jgi:hypothetical protein
MLHPVVSTFILVFQETYTANEAYLIIIEIPLIIIKGTTADYNQLLNVSCNVWSKTVVLVLHTIHFPNTSLEN